MTRYNENFESGTDGSAVTGSGTIFAAPVYGGVGGAIVYDNDHPAKGTLGTKITKLAGSGSAYLSYNITVSTKAIATTFYMWSSTWPQQIYFGAYNGTTRIGSMTMNTSTKLRLTGAASSSDHVFTSTENIPTSQLVRYEVYLKVGTTTSNGEGRIAAYLGDSTTPITDSGLVTGMNLGTADVTVLRFGMASTTAEQPTLFMDAIMIEDAATGLLGPYVEPSTPLDTPVITLGSIIKPSAIGEDDGSITFTWAPITGANHYEAAIAVGDVTSGFTASDTNATSPKTFSGLTAGTYTVAVRAIAP